MRSGKRLTITSLAVLLAAGCAAGQTDGSEGADRAERLLERTVAVLEKEMPAYKTSTEITADGVAVPQLKTRNTGSGGTVAGEPAGWELEKSVRYLRKAAKTVKLEPDPGSQGGQVLTVTVSGSEWTTLMKKDWQERIAVIETEADAAIRQQTARVSGDKAVWMKHELTASLEKARTRMEQLVGSLEAEGVYTIRLKRGAARPDTMTVENRFRYRTGGAERSETVRTTYDFTRGPVSP